MSRTATKTHYSAAELAALQLPGLPGTQRGVLDRATRENWPVIEAKGSGGPGGIRREYAPPAPIMAAIRAKAAQTLVASVQPSTALIIRPESTASHQIETAEQALKTDARRGVLQALERMMAQTGYPLKRCAQMLVSMAKTGHASEQMIAMLKLARDERGRCSEDGLPSDRSLLRFVERERNGELAPKVRQRDMSIPAWAPSFLVHFQRPEKPTVAHAYEEWAKSMGRENVPSIYVVRRFLEKVGSVAREVGRMGGNELKSVRPFVRRKFDQLLPDDIFSADGHTFKGEVQHPIHGKAFRPELTEVVSIGTRKVVGWSAGLAESSYVVVDALRRAVETHGIPAIFYVDNGSGYKNHTLTDIATGMIARLGIDMRHSLPYNSQARGVIERLHQTLWVKLAKKLPGYMGKDMDREAKLAVFKLSRKALKPGAVEKMPLLSWQGFLDACQERIDEYNATPHRSLQKITCPTTGRRRNMTPNEAWDLHVAQGFESHMVSDIESRPLFRPQILRPVRRGEIQLFSNTYFARELEEFGGDQMRIGYDVHDPHHVWVYDDEGRFVCKAEWNGNKRDYMPKSVVDQAREKRAIAREKRLGVHLEEVRAERYGTPAIEMPESVNIPGFLTVKVSDLPARAAEAELIMEPPQPQPLQRAIAPDPLPELVPATPAWAVPETPDGRWAAWLELGAIPEEEITDEKQKIWRMTYQSTAEFRMYSRKVVSR
jgi:putative transposase